MLIFLLILGSGVGIALATQGTSVNAASVWMGIAALSCALIVSRAINVADQWEKAVVLRLGKFRALSGPGLFFIVPVIDTTPHGLIPV